MQAVMIKPNILKSVPAAHLGSCLFTTTHIWQSQNEDWLHGQIIREMPQFPRKTQTYIYVVLTLPMNCFQ